MSVSRTWSPRLVAAFLLFAFGTCSQVQAESSDGLGEGLTPSPASMDTQAAAQRQPSTITGVLMQARGGRATEGGFLDMVNRSDAPVGGADKVAEKGSDCCFANGTPGCDDPTCEADVCALDSFCCDTEWDGICADQALITCPILCGAPPPPPGEGDCCEANGTPGCDDATCQADVCVIDPFCCDTEWDGICAGEAADFCAVCGGDPGGPVIDILVNTNADGIPTDDGFCTLREAVMTANGVFFDFKSEGECQFFAAKGPGGILIGFDPLLAGATISLTITDVSEEPGPDPKGPPPPSISDFFGPTALLVTSSIIIAGDPDDGIIIERSLAAPDMRLFLILSPFLCELKGGLLCPDPKSGDDKGFSTGVEFVNVTLQNGIARGGDGGDGGFDEFIDNKGGGNVSEATLEGGGGGGAGGFGGAVLNLFGFVSFENSTLNNNQAIGGNGGIAGAAAPEKGGPDLDATGGGGGGIGGNGFDGGNTGSDSGDGGGLDGGTSPGSSGFFGGGGAGASESFSGGDGGGFGGGGGGASVKVSIFAKGAFDVSGRGAGENFFVGGGGGGGATASVLTQAKGTGPGSPDFGGFGAGDGSFESGGGGAGMGGAVFNFGGEAISINSTFSGNSAIGGTGVDDPAPPPKGEPGSAQGEGLGGGIINVSGFLFMNNTTLSGNRADDGGGAVFHLEAGNINPFCLAKDDKGDCDCSAFTGVFDSILANSLNLATDFDGDDISAFCLKGLAPGVAVENSLIETPPFEVKMEKGGVNVIIGVDPQLGALADNTGPSNTHLPQPGSPVIDAVISPVIKTPAMSPQRLRAKGVVIGPVFCEERDQRGVPRPQLAECDMGSVEVLPGTIQVCKELDPSPKGKTNQGFSFSGDFGGFGVEPGLCATFEDLVPADYTVLENDPEPVHYLGSIVCESDGPNSSWVTDVDTRSVDITLWEDETVVCTFTNLEPGTIIITKSTDVATAELFGFSEDITPPVKDGEKGPGPDFTLASGASLGFPFVEPGAYSVSEIDPFPLNFALDSIVCDDANSSGAGFTATINVEPGETVECVFNNVELLVQLSLSKTAEGVPTDAFIGDQYSYHMVLTNNGPGFATNVVVLDPLPPEIVFVSSACATENPAGTARWDVGTILTGQTLFCDFIVEIVDIGIIENIALAVGDQGDGGGDNEGGVIVKGATPVIPTLGPWALGLLVLVLGLAGVRVLRRRPA